MCEDGTCTLFPDRDVTALEGWMWTRVCAREGESEQEQKQTREREREREENANETFRSLRFFFSSDTYIASPSPPSLSLHLLPQHLQQRLSLAITQAHHHSQTLTHSLTGTHQHIRHPHKGEKKQRGASVPLCFFVPFPVEAVEHDAGSLFWAVPRLPHSSNSYSSCQRRR